MNIVKIFMRLTQNVGGAQKVYLVNQNGGHHGQKTTQHRNRSSTHLSSKSWYRSNTFVYLQAQDKKKCRFNLQSLYS